MKNKSMIRIFLFLILPASLFMVSCSPDDCSQLERKNGLWVTTDNKPYSGTCQKCNEEGAVELEMSVKEGLKHGTFMRFAPNGKITFHAEYINGEPQGEYIQYFNDGRIKSLRLLHDSVYIYAGWGVEGSLRIVREETQDTLANGRTVVYSESGKLQSIFQFQNGRKDGNFMTWHDNGLPEMTGKYNNNAADGMWLKFYASGKHEGYELYTKGDRIGTWKYYHENGKIKVMYRFQQNLMVRQTSWNENGVKTDELIREL